MTRCMGSRQWRFSIATTKRVCYASLYIFCGGHLLAAKLRPSNVDPAGGALDELKRIIPQLRQCWPQVQLVVRGDNAYARDDIMSWCEARGIDACLWSSRQ